MVQVWKMGEMCIEMMKISQRAGAGWRQSLDDDVLA